MRLGLCPQSTTLSAMIYRSEVLNPRAKSGAPISGDQNEVEPFSVQVEGEFLTERVDAEHSSGSRNRYTSGDGNRGVHESLCDQTIAEEHVAKHRFQGKCGNGEKMHAPWQSGREQEVMASVEVRWIIARGDP